VEDDMTLPVVLRIDDETNSTSYASPGGRSYRNAEISVTHFPFIHIRLPNGYVVGFNVNNLLEHIQRSGVAEGLAWEWRTESWQS
jgi:hypothetical protein